MKTDNMFCKCWNIAAVFYEGWQYHVLVYGYLRGRKYVYVYVVLMFQLIYYVFMSVFKYNSCL